MDSTMIARLGAFVFVGIVVGAALVEVTRKPEDPPLYRSFPPLTEQAPDALRAALRQCRDIGEAATRDPTCLKIWAENRDRFLGGDRSRRASLNEER